MSKSARERRQKAKVTVSSFTNMVNYLRSKADKGKEPNAPGLTFSNSEVRIFGTISDWADDVTLDWVIEQLDQVTNSDEVTVRINSTGGSVFEGFAIYNALLESGKRIRTVNEGAALSIAAYVFLAGDERVARPNGKFMFHKPSVSAMGDANDLRDTAVVLDMMEEQMVSDYVKNTGNEEARFLIGDRKKWLTAHEALAMNIATEVTSPREKAPNKEGKNSGESILVNLYQRKLALLENS